MSHEERFWSKVDVGPGCWVWTAGHTPRGYGHFWLNGRTRRAHVVAWELEYGKTALHVLHHCDNPPCVRPSHLFAGTDADNAADRDAKGRTAKGERSGRYTKPERTARGERVARARLTTPDVKSILNLARDGVMQTEIAKFIGVDHATVNHVLRGRTWGHVTGLRCEP